MRRLSIAILFGLLAQTSALADSAQQTSRTTGGGTVSNMAPLAPTAILDANGNPIYAPASTTNPLPVSVAGGSGTAALPQAGLAVLGDTSITVGGTAQNLFASAIPTNGYRLGNPNASDDCWFSDTTTAAVNAQGSYFLAHGGGYYETPPGMKPSAAVSISCPVTGDKVSAVKW